MKHKRFAGFTLIELLVTVTIIVVIATLAAFGYMTVQRQSIDSKREADILSLQAELEKFFEKNGEYPPACPRPSANCTSRFYTDNTSAPMTYSTSSLADVRAVLPGLANDFGEPGQTSNQPFSVDTRAKAKGYYYLSGAVNNTSSSSSLAVTLSSTLFPCSMRIALGPGDTSSYVVGYYSEKQSKWILKSGKNGKKLTVNSGDCVIN